ncbi:helix-turn-helix domain-containing protein [Paenibacillus paeoniae]|uniref:AraC family transcriptional regulator n=1 Tax=Paenibacillus paeoniae TaxID=2292705 RepID=A0A371PM85_9BACL|nr:AraC family transcriptional regulator [Paenibacillus paeoniae]REK76759.1 AraC family transcriptional regulator [Paenibacillus paeoniae]
MNSSAVTRIYQQYFEEALLQQEDGRTYLFQKNTELGAVYRVTTYSGIEIVYSDIQVGRPGPIAFSASGQMIELQFTLAGERQAEVSGTEYSLPDGQGAFVFLQDFEVHFHTPAKGPYVTFALGIPVTLFHYAILQLAADRIKNLEFRRIIEGQMLKAYAFQIDSYMLAMIHALINDLKGPHTSPLLLEASALEMLNRLLLQVFELTPLPEGLSREDVRKLHHAREVLESRLTEPPSLLALSRIIGLNDFKLKKGFKACFGATVFDYLREVRLNRAMAMLRNEEANVTKAAVTVGYSNTSAFAEQFCKRFGVKPSAVKKM